MLSIWDPLGERQATRRHRTADPFWQLMSFDPFRDAQRQLEQSTGFFRDDSCQIVNDANSFGVNLDVRQYKPEEVKVR